MYKHVDRIKNNIDTFGRKRTGYIKLIHKYSLLFIILTVNPTCYGMSRLMCDQLKRLMDHDL